jgi:hypothetical protein
MGGAVIDAVRLAKALAQRLEPVVSSQFAVTTASASIRLAIRGTPWWSEQDLRWMLDNDELEDSVCFAVERVLDDFQDFIAHTFAEPWPAASPGPMPQPFAQSVDGLLVAGYGDPADPFVQLQPIRLRDLV